MKQVLFAVAMSLAASLYSAAEDDSSRITIRFRSGSLTMLLSARHVDFSANDPPKDQSGGKGVLPRRCLLEGDARISIADDDVVIVADRLEFQTQGNTGLPTTIKGTGACKWTDSDYTISADRFEVVNGENGKAVFTGNAAFIQRDGTALTRVSADKFTLRDGNFVGEDDVRVSPAP